MSKYEVRIMPDAEKDISNFCKAGKKSVLKKIDTLLEELKVHPRFGTGKPEHLKHISDVERWSRRITKKHRLVYDIEEKEIVVLVVSAYGHYKDE